MQYIHHPGTRPSLKEGLGLNDTGSHIPGPDSAFPTRSGPGDQFCNTNGIMNFPASSHARKKQRNSVQGGNNLPQATLPPGSPPLTHAALSPKAPNFSFFSTFVGF